MRLRNVLVAACLMAAAFVTPMMERLAAQSISTGIVISEFRLRGQTSINDEFIELFNSSTASITVGGWVLRASNAAGTIAAAPRATIPAGVSIGPGCFYLITFNNTGYTGSVTGNLTYGTGFADNGGVALALATGQIIDRVGHSTLGFREGTPLPVLTLDGTDRSFERRPGGTDGHVDTGDNLVDFREISPSNPQNASSACLSTTNPSVTGSASPSPVEQGQVVTLSAQVSAGSVPPSTGLQVVGNLSAIGGSPSQAFADNGVFPDLTPNDRVFTTALTVPVNNPVGPQSLALTVTDAQGREGHSVLSLTINPPAVVYLPHEIQGAGAASPLATGTAVIVRGIVTARKSDGFFLQTEPGTEDADPATSEGLFVFVDGGAPPEAVVEHLAVVRGSVAELPSAGGGSITGLSAVTAVTDLGLDTLPEPYALTSADVSATGAADQLERFEGMRVTASLTAISGTGGDRSEANFSAASDGTFFAVLTGQPRPFRGPGVEAGYPVLPCAFATCNIPAFDGNPERLRVDSDALEGTAAADVSSGAVMTVTGPLDFGFATYTLLPEDTLTPAGETPTVPAPAAAADQFTIASFNMDRFFDTVNDPGPDVVVTPQAFERRLAKASMAIRDVLNTPDVIGFQGVEKLQVLNDLATRIDLDAAVAGTPAPNYAAYLVEGSDEEGLDVGFLVKTAGGRVTATSAVQVGVADTFEDPADPAVTHLVNDRPPLVLQAVIEGPATRPAQTLTVIVNHLRSLDDVYLDDDTGRRVRAQRRAQAEWLAAYINDRQPSEAIVSLGGYNAFGFNDGYVDTVGTILGTPAPEDQVALASADLVTPDLVDLANFTAESERYSSLSRGNAQALDHALVTANLAAQFAALVHPRVNADFADVLRGNGSTPRRVSDSDPGVAYFYFPPDNVPPVFSVTPEVDPVEATSADGAIVTYEAPTATDNLDGGVDVVCEPASGATQPLGNTGVTCTAADAAGNVASVSFTVTVEDTTAPDLVVPGAITIEADSAAGKAVSFTVSATDVVTEAPVVTCSHASGATFALGTTTVTCEATDAAGNSSDGTFTVTVQDTAAPQLTVPDSITTEAASAAGTSVTFTVSATDNVTVAPVVTCSHASGATFALGTTTVTCDATDAAGNSDQDAFTVTVRDTTAPQLALPAGVTAEAASAGGTVITFAVSATDSVTAAPVVTCTPASGATFPLGLTTVTCDAADAAGNTSDGTFTVTVQDTTAPQLTVPADINEQANSPDGRVISFTASAIDAVTSSLVVTCSPASGSTFPIGVTLVHCSTADAAGNSAGDSFAVTITAVVPGRMHGAGAVGSGAARVFFRMDVQESANYVERGSLLVTIGGNYLLAGVSDVVFADSVSSSATQRRPLPDSVTFSGSGTWNGQSGYTYLATASDLGEPGRGRDTLTVVVRAPNGSVVATLGGTLTSGNIQSLR